MTQIFLDYLNTQLTEGFDLSPLITHRISIDDFEDGFEAMRSGSAGKVVMDWT